MDLTLILCASSLLQVNPDFIFYKHEKRTSEAKMCFTMNEWMNEWIKKNIANQHYDSEYGRLEP